MTVAAARGKRSEMILGALGLLLIGACVISFPLGRFAISPGLVVQIMGSKLIAIPHTWSATMETVVWQIRLPRIVAAILIGGSLAAAGAAYQSVFRNPLVSPSILGVSAGASFGAMLGILLHAPWAVVELAAFLLGLLAAALSFAVGRAFGRTSAVVLVLGGIVITALFQALVSITKYLADPTDTLPAITFWLLGSLAKVTNTDLLRVLAPMLLSHPSIPSPELMYQ